MRQEEIVNLGFKGLVLDAFAEAPGFELGEVSAANSDSMTLPPCQFFGLLLESVPWPVHQRARGTI